MVKQLYISLICLLATVACLFLAACAFVNQPRFGRLPEGERLARIEGSPNYRDGEFQNLMSTPKFSKDVGTISVIWNGFFDKAERLVPEKPIPVLKTDLKALYPKKDIVIWLGHSSWFIQVGGKRILIDPVFSDFAAPFSFFNKAFPGTSIYRAEDMPMIDCLLISHDHWDHLDYPTVVALRSKIKQVICPLGIGACFEYWDFLKANIREGDWYDAFALGKDITIHVLPARHYSGRLLAQNKTLWAGFAIESRGQRIFFSGDSGYGPHFAQIKNAFKGFDLVIMDCGQYDPRWAYIHMTPEEAVQATRDLGAHALIPAHVGRFAIANHPWDEPFKRLTEASQGRSFRLFTPRIGEPVVPDNNPSRFSRWWESEASNP